MQKASRAGCFYSEPPLFWAPVLGRPAHRSAPFEDELFESDPFKNGTVALLEGTKLDANQPQVRPTNRASDSWASDDRVRSRRQPRGDSPGKVVPRR
jgi:hypothetical protein